MILPLKWAVWLIEHKKKYEKARSNHYKKPLPAGATEHDVYPEYVSPPREPTPGHDLPQRLLNRSSWFAYFMIGPMCEGLHGIEKIPSFDPFTVRDTNDRSGTSRVAQKRREQAEREDMVKEAKLRSMMEQTQKINAIKAGRARVKKFADTFRSATICKMSSDADVRTELLQRSSRTKQLKQMIDVMTKFGTPLQQQEDVSKMMNEMMQIVQLPHPDPKDSSTFHFVSRVVSVPEAAYKVDWMDLTVDDDFSAIPLLIQSDDAPQENVGSTHDSEPDKVPFKPCSSVLGDPDADLELFSIYASHQNYRTVLSTMLKLGMVKVVQVSWNGLGC